MNGQLRTIDWRLERADEHLAALDRERSAFMGQEDGGIVGEFDRDASEYVFRFTGELPDPRIGLIVGEFAHNLRSALDNLLWQVVLARGGCPTSKTQFPIRERREGYRRTTADLVRGVGADDRALIEACQPYQWGGNASNHFLVVLSWLNNVDKHRLVHVGCVLPERVPISVSYGAEGEDAGLWPWNPIFIRDVAKIVEAPYVPVATEEDRAELLRVPIEPSGPDPQMKVQGGATVDVVLSDPERHVVLRDLRRIRSFVGNIVDAFRPSVGLEP